MGEAWVLPWNSLPNSAKTVDKVRQASYLLVDEVKPNSSCHWLEDSSRLVDEAQESSSEALPVDVCGPVSPSHIRIIGPRHPTLIVSSLDCEN
ncbi:hypothetical protein O181_082941, partial [Austropuccinia psidii MF-1]|nr:hypothetical protein [Austropuccinia psidii MF-1]